MPAGEPTGAPTARAKAGQEDALRGDEKESGDAASKLQYGYADGFFVASPAAIKLKASDDVPFLLRVNSRLQLRHTLFDSHGANPDENDFEFERAFLIFSGYVHSPDLSYHIKLDGDSDEGEGVDLLDYYVTYDWGHDQGGLEQGRFGLKAGKWKMPFHRARYESGFNLQFADRAMASEFFDINRSLGVGLFGQFDVHCQPVNWEMALFNGFLTQRFTPGRGELDRNFGYAARVFADLVGEWGKDGEPDYAWHEAAAVRVGTAVAWTRLDRDDGMREFAGPPGLRVVDSGASIASVVPPGTNEFNVLLYAVDANFKYRGLSLMGEYYMRSLNGFSGAAVSDLFDHGFLVQSGYFIVREKVEVFARWSRVVGDSGTLGFADQSADEVGGGAAWFIRGHNLKFVSDVTHLNGAPVNSTAANIRPGDDGWLVRTQLQFMF